VAEGGNVLAKARTFTLDGVSARPVDVEVHVQRGLPAFSVVGLPDAAVRESRERVRSALVNCGWDFPLRRITVNLAPADLRKGGPAFDLAIAAALLVASDQLPGALLGELALGGELALDGSVRGVAGVLAMAEAASRLGIEGIAVSAANAPEAALIPGLRVVPLERLDQLAGLAAGEWSPPLPEPLPLVSANGSAPDLSDLRGQPMLRHGLEVAAAGGHSMLIVGPPGAGKSLGARRLASILPPLRDSEALEVARIASVCGRLGAHLGAARPFRAPHHTISAAGLVGGGNPPRPGEVTLAHRGVLFLDELGEFGRQALESLRAPMEDGTVRITRAGHATELPCRFALVAAANPCPCGRGEADEDCRCSPHDVLRYQARLSGALADRIDISLAVTQPSAEAMAGEKGESSEGVRARVLAARERQERRLGGRSNAEMTTTEVRALELEPQARELLTRYHRELRLSGRAHDRLIRVACTLADLERSDLVGEGNVLGALGLRIKDTLR
jgi:magnesium chelatase family protein